MGQNQSKSELELAELLNTIKKGDDHNNHYEQQRAQQISELSVDVEKDLFKNVPNDLENTIIVDDNSVNINNKIDSFLELESANRDLTLEEQNQELQQKLEESNSIIEKIRNQLLNKKKKIAYQHQKIKEITQQLESQKEIIKENQKSLLEETKLANHQLKKKDKEIAKLKKNISETENHNNILEIELQNATKELECLRKELESLYLENNEYKIKLTKFEQSSFIKLAEKKTKLEETINRLFC